MDQVVWCSRQIRTRLAQKNAVSAPAQDIDHRPPIKAGASSVTATSPGNHREIARISVSASRSGQKRSCDVRSELNSQPTWAKASPLVSAFQSLPNRHGECGSPSLSLYLWCLRWSATQVITGPSMARDPATASAILNPRTALNDPWVK